MASIAKNTDVPIFQHYVGGRWVSAVSNRTVLRCNPADCNDVIGSIPLAPKEEVAKAIDAAVDATQRWRATPPPNRGRFLLEAAGLVKERKSILAEIITREEGKTLSEASGEVELTVRVLEFMAGEGYRLSGETLPSEHSGKFVYTLRQPVGVVGLITPWNFPLAVPIWKIAPALVCGNSVVWKPSRLTPLISRTIIEIFADIDLPAGVLNLVNGAGSEAGDALVEHPSVRAISFTSSFDVGVEIYSKAARLFKKVQCEAGGKNAVIVLADADLKLAADSIICGAFQFTGQRCTATSWVIVVNEIADALVQMLIDRAQSLVVGNGMNPQTDMGPVADEAQMKRILEFVEIGKTEGDLVCGGRRLTGQGHSSGLFISPTIFDSVPPDAETVREEIFGPVLSVVRVRTAADATRIANNGRYGMVTSIFSRDASSIFGAARDLECGVVHVNAATTGAEVHVPFGGIKDTGVGEREMGSTARNFYTELKVVYVNHSS